ncbi:MAG: dipeptidyl-peptidase 3 family protein, partial [Bacteroidota bacterium]
MKAKFYLPLIALLFSCSTSGKKETTSNDSSNSKVSIETESDFIFQADQFADLRILRFQVPGFTNLKPQQKELLYYLYEAALCGRDIIWDQNCKVNLTIRKFIENTVSTFKGNKETEDYKKFLTYAKRVWFSNGIHHHYSSDKILPEFSSQSFLDTLILLSDKNGLPLESNESVSEFSKRIGKVILDPNYLSKKVSLDPRKDLLTSSAVNMYEGLTQNEASAFYLEANKNNGETPVMTGLNSKLLKKDGKIEEKKWMVGGMYTKAIEKIVYWLEKAAAIAETPEQKSSLEKLIKFYKTGDLKDFDEYSIAWVKDVNSPVDVVNGFIETYN